MAKKPKYSDKNVGIDDSEFQRKAKKLIKQFGLDETEFIKDQARLLAREAAKFTPPFAGGVFPDWNTGTGVGTKADIEAGENYIKGDIKQICFVVPEEKAWEQYRKSKGGPVYRYGTIVSPGVITSGFKLYRWHQNNRDRYGRTKELSVPNMPWVGRALVDEYIKDMQKHAGMSKAAFLKASIGFGGKVSAPPKIKRHLARASGSGRLVKNAKGPIGYINAMADGLYHTKRMLPHLMRNRLEKAVKRLEYIGKQAAKKAEFKTN